jgi:hypothetical protein
MNKLADEPIPNATKGIDSTTQTIPSAAKVTLDLTISLNASGGSMASEFGMGTGQVVFSREPGRGTTAVHFELYPRSLRKQPATRNPRMWATGALGGLAMAGTAIRLRMDHSHKR